MLFRIIGAPPAATFQDNMHVRHREQEKQYLLLLSCPTGAGGTDECAQPPINHCTLLSSIYAWLHYTTTTTTTTFAAATLPS